MATITVTELSSFAIALQKMSTAATPAIRSRAATLLPKQATAVIFGFGMVALAAALCGAAGLGLYARKKARNSQ